MPSQAVGDHMIQNAGVAGGTGPGNHFWPFLPNSRLRFGKNCSNRYRDDGDDDQEDPDCGKSDYYDEYDYNYAVVTMPFMIYKERKQQ